LPRNISGKLVYRFTSPSVYRFTGLPVDWFSGFLVYWSVGLLVFWFTGPLVNWFTGPAVYRSTGMLATDPSAHWPNRPSVTIAVGQAVDRDTNPSVHRFIDPLGHRSTVYGRSILLLNRRPGAPVNGCRAF